MIAALVGGRLADVVGRRRTMAVAMFGGAAMILGLSLTTSAPVLIVGCFAAALVLEMYRPAAAALVSDHVEPAQQVHAFGLMYLAINLGFTIAPIVGG